MMMMIATWSFFVFFFFSKKIFLFLSWNHNLFCPFLSLSFCFFKCPSPIISSNYTHRHHHHNCNLNSLLHRTKCFTVVVMCLWKFLFFYINTTNLLQQQQPLPWNSQSEHGFFCFFLSRFVCFFLLLKTSIFIIKLLSFV